MRDHKSIVVARNIAEEIRIQIPFIEVHGYFSRSYGSYYMKFDYGLGGSLHIADYDRRKIHLKYKYNLMLQEKGGLVIRLDEGIERRFYGSDLIPELIFDLVIHIAEKRREYGDRYKILMEEERRKSLSGQGFWRDAKSIAGKGYG